MTNEELAIQIQLGHTGLYGKLWESCRSLLFMILSSMTEKIPLPNYLSADDLRQTMFFALQCAVNSFDPDKGLKLSSYFRFSILNVLRKTIPQHAVTEISYNQPMQDDEGVESAEMIDFIEDSTALERFEDVEQYNLSCIVKNALQRLPEQERKIILLRFMHEQTLKKTGELLGQPTARVRYLETKALSKLRTGAIGIALRRQLESYY